MYARSYDAIWDSPLTRSVASAVFDVSAGSDVVDLGCGTGLVARVFVGHGSVVTGVDSSALMLRRAQAKSRVSTCVLATANRTALASTCADTVLLINILHLLDDPVAALLEAIRLVRPGGRIVLAWPLDGVTTDSVRRADRLSGRGIVRSAVAHHLREAIGVMSWALRVDRKTAAELTAIVHEMAAQHDLIPEPVVTIHGVQAITALRVPVPSLRLSSLA